MKTSLEDPTIRPRGLKRQTRFRGESVESRRKAITRILVPIDLSRGSLKAIPGAKVVLVHAVEQPWFPMGDPYTALATATLVAESQKAACKQMQQMAAEAGQCGSVQVVRGSPPIAICDCASRENIELIVISTHGRSRLRHALIGSVAERVVRYADCPVLVIPARWATIKPSLN